MSNGTEQHVRAKTLRFNKTPSWSTSSSPSRWTTIQARRDTPSSSWSSTHHKSCRFSLTKVCAIELVLFCFSLRILCGLFPHAFAGKKRKERERENSVDALALAGARHQSLSVRLYRFWPWLVRRAPESYTHLCLSLGDKANKPYKPDDYPWV